MDDEGESEGEARVEETSSGESDAFRDMLVRGSDQWWQFLDAKTGGETVSQGRGRSGSDSRAATVRTAPGATSRGFQCEACGGQNPADATFCFFCGAEPTERLGFQQILVVIREIRDPRLKHRLARIVSEADEPLEEEELKEMLSAPPCYLFADGPPGQIEAMLERLGHLGIQARGTTIEATGIGWYWEILESMLRSNRWLAGTFGVFLLAAGLWWLWGIAGGLVGGGALVWLLYEHGEWYRTHHRVRADSVLERLAGFRPESARRARDLLSGLMDTDIKKSLTVCLMEYYAVWHQLHASESLRGGLSRRLRQRLGDFLAHVLDACERFDRIHRFVEGAEMGGDGSKERSISAERKEELEGNLASCRRQMVELTSSIESLRARFLAMGREGDEGAEVKMRDLLDDLDTEAEVLEETLVEIGETV